MITAVSGYNDRVGVIEGEIKVDIDVDVGNTRVEVGVDAICITVMVGSKVKVAEAGSAVSVPAIARDSATPVATRSGVGCITCWIIPHPIMDSVLTKTRPLMYRCRFMLFIFSVTCLQSVVL